MDGELNMQVHIGKISCACFHHLRRLRQLRNIMFSATMQSLVSEFVLSRSGLPAVTLKQMQSYERGSSSSRRTWLERSHLISNARFALAADRLSNQIQTLHPKACRSK